MWTMPTVATSRVPTKYFGCGGIKEKKRYLAYNVLLLREVRQVEVLAALVNCVGLDYIYVAS